MKIALLHYSCSPIVGGVEWVMEQHAALFARHGHQITIICESSEGRRFHRVPELGATHPLTREAQAELDRGSPGEAFARLTRRFVEVLTPVLKAFDIVFIHNILTMPFNLACTSALWDMAGVTRFVGWIHDVAAANPDYIFPHLGKFPWKLLTCADPAIEYVAVSGYRKHLFQELTGGDCRVIPNGVSPSELLELTPAVAKLADSENLWDQDLILLHPARVLRRKNIELGIRTAAALAAKGCKCRYLVTGAPDLHNPSSAKYAAFLGDLREELAGPNTIFLNERFEVTREDMASLYRVADLLFFPSRQEGFGIPLLEAAVCGLPIACADVPPMNSLWRRDAVTFFDPDTEPEALAFTLQEVARKSAVIRNRKFAIRGHSWDNIYTNYLEPLLSKKLDG